MVSRYRALFTAFEIRPQDILLRLPNHRLYIRPHFQEYLVGLGSELEEHLTRWVLAVQNALRTDAALPPFPAAAAAPPEEALASESDPRLGVKWRLEILLIETWRTPRSPEADMSRHWDAPEFP